MCHMDTKKIHFYFVEEAAYYSLDFLAVSQSDGKFSLVCILHWILSHHNNCSARVHFLIPCGVVSPDHLSVCRANDSQNLTCLSGCACYFLMLNNVLPSTFLQIQRHVTDAETELKGGNTNAIARIIPTTDLKWWHGQRVVWLTMRGRTSGMKACWSLLRLENRSVDSKFIILCQSQSI